MGVQEAEHIYFFYLWSLGLNSPHAVDAVDDGVLRNLLTRVEPTARADDAAARQDHVAAHFGYET